MVMACLEGFSFRASGVEPLLRLSAMFAGGAVGMVSLSRYARMLSQAWRAAVALTGCAADLRAARLKNRTPSTSAGARSAGSAQLMVCWK